MPHNPAVFRSGFVALVGRPNAGKSTLLNTLVGSKIAIVTDKPQTTRNRILGIVHQPNAQLVLMDTPGIHKPFSELNRQMMTHVHGALREMDLLLLMVDATEPFGQGDQFVLELLKPYRGKRFLLLNKIDLVRKPKLLPLISRYTKAYEFDEVFPISALQREGLSPLLRAASAVLPEGPQYFPPDMCTDQPERFLAAEIVREKLIQATRKELPYVTAILVESFEETERLTRIHATILVERASQKAIVIGEKGERIKSVGTAARLELEKRFGQKVYLELFVKVAPRWRDDTRLIDSLDYQKFT